MDELVGTATSSANSMGILENFESFANNVYVQFCINIVVFAYQATAIYQMHVDSSFFASNV